MLRLRSSTDQRRRSTHMLTLPRATAPTIRLSAGKRDATGSGHRSTSEARSGPRPKRKCLRRVNRQDDGPSCALLRCSHFWPSRPVFRWPKSSSWRRVSPWPWSARHARSCCSPRPAVSFALLLVALLVGTLATASKLKLEFLLTPVLAPDLEYYINTQSLEWLGRYPILLAFTVVTLALVPLLLVPAWTLGSGDRRHGNCGIGVRRLIRAHRHARSGCRSRGKPVPARPVLAVHSTSRCGRPSPTAVT